MDKKNLGQKTVRWMSAFLLVMFIIYGLVSLGKTDWLNWIAIVFGFFISGFLFIQSGIVEYLRKKDYKKLGVGDFVVWLSVAVGVLIALNSILLINVVKEAAPLWLTNFATSIGVGSAVVGSVVSIVHLFAGRFK